MGQQVVQIGGIGTEQSATFAVGDGDIENRRRVANGRVQQRRESGIAAQCLGHCSAQRSGIVGVDLRPADVGLNRAPSREENLVRHHVVGGVSLRHSLAQKLAKKYPRQGAHHQEYQSGDREHELGLQSHGGVTRNLLSTIERLAIGTCLGC